MPVPEASSTETAELLSDAPTAEKFELHNELNLLISFHVSV
jgi:hypothetical protein